MRKLFSGGVHPKHKKEMSTKSAMPSEIIPKQVIIPMLQHIGVACNALVKPGDYVLAGQKIGDGNDKCVPIHASVSGTVTQIKPYPHPNGQLIEAVVIDNDYKDAHIEYKGNSEPLDTLDVDSLLHTIHEAGIIGMGGAAFPGSIKALSAMENADTLIANACECEPYITSDDILMRTEPKQIFEGMMIVSRIISPKRLIIAIEDNKAQAIEKLNLIKKDYPLVEIKVLPTMYPQGSEKQLVKALTCKEIPPKSLPTSVGCVVFNVSTFAAIYKAVRLGMPLTQRIITVTGEAVKNPQNFTVRIGTPFSELIDGAGGLYDDANCVINGGPMMGTAQGELCVPAIKATNAVLCLFKYKKNDVKEPVCIRCGKCVEVCPMHLEPLFLYSYAISKNINELNRFNINDCLECGCCAYICPGKLSLVKQFRIGKELVKEASSK